MPRPKKHVVELSEAQREQLKRLIGKGEANARVLRRARVLLLAHGDWFDRMSPRCSGAVPKLDSRQEALLVALACSKPENRETWAMQLLADRLVRDGPCL